MPTPVSETDTNNLPASCCTATEILPSDVYFIALLRMFAKTRVSRSRSPVISGMSCGTSVLSLIPLSSIVCCIYRVVSFIISPSEICSFLSRMIPVSRLASSVISIIIRVMRFNSCRIASRLPFCSFVILPRCRSRSSSRCPSIDVSGSRRSSTVLAKNLFFFASADFNSLFSEVSSFTRSESFSDSISLSGVCGRGLMPNPIDPIRISVINHIPRSSVVSDVVSALAMAIATVTASATVNPVREVLYIDCHP